MWSGKVCVPIDPTEVWAFDPDKVPTVDALLEELNAYVQKKEPGESAHHSGKVCSQALGV